MIRNRLFELYAMAPTAPSAPLLVTFSEEKIAWGQGCGASSAHQDRILLKLYFGLAPLAKIDTDMYRFATKQGLPMGLNISLIGCPG